MRHTETSEQGNPQPDVFKDARKEANDILRLAAEKNLQINITVLGALHNGIPGNDILEILLYSDISSFELPSQAVRAYLKSYESKIDEKIFWETVIDASQKPIGVNNHAGAVNGIRILDDRVRKGQAIPTKFPDLAISSQDMKFGTGNRCEETVIDDNETLDQLKEQEAGFKDKYPARAYVLKDGVAHFVHVNRPVPEKKAKALLVSGNYMLPTEYFMTHGAEIFGDEIGGMAGVDLCEFAVSHFIRTHVDKTQVMMMLAGLRSVVKQTVDGESVALTHTGGAAHNPNILAILEKVIGKNPRVTLSEVRDGRMPDVSSDKLTFFSKLIPVEDAIGAIEMINDQAVVNVAKADAALRKVTVQKELLKDFCRREKLAREFEYVVDEPNNSGQVEYFTVRNLLALISPDEAESLGKVNAYYPLTLANFITQTHPELIPTIENLMVKYHDRRLNFPPEEDPSLE